MKNTLLQCYVHNEHNVRILNAIEFGDIFKITLIQHTSKRFFKNIIRIQEA